MKSAFNTVKEILEEQTGCNPEVIIPTAKLVEDLGLDCLDMIELLMAFEDEYQQECPDKDAERLKTVGDIVAYIEKNVRKDS